MLLLKLDSEGQNSMFAVLGEEAVEAPSSGSALDSKPPLRCPALGSCSLSPTACKDCDALMYLFVKLCSKLAGSMMSSCPAWPLTGLEPVQPILEERWQACTNSRWR